MEEFERYTFELRCIPPDRSGLQMTRFAISLDNGAIKEAFNPLPRDRDLPDYFGDITQRARIEAARQQQIRRDVVRDISRQFSEKLMTFIESRDPVMGYDPQP